jgi:ERCC4-type nuclease
MSAVELLIDIRERGLGALLTTLGVPFRTAALDVGDLLFQKADGTPLLVAERKSHADFAASNNDGRYREQRARLMAVRGSGVAVLYILEGEWSDTEWRQYGRTTEAALKRLTTRLILRYGMPVLAAASLADTARWCRTLLSQLTDDPTVFQPEGDMATATMAAMTAMTAVLSTAKKGNKTAAGTAAAMLTAIPGLGAKKVAELAAAHSIAALAGMTAAEIGALVVGGKRLGAALGMTIYEALHAKSDQHQ